MDVSAVVLAFLDLDEALADGLVAKLDDANDADLIILRGASTLLLVLFSFLVHV